MISTRTSWPLACLACVESLLLVGIVYVIAAESAARGAVPFDAMGLLAPTVLICALVVLMMFAVGLYTWHLANNFTDLLMRVVAAFALAYAVYAAVVFPIEPLYVSPQPLMAAMAVSVVGVFGIRVVFLQVADMAHLKARVLIVGTGERAARIAALEDRGIVSRFRVMAFIDVNEASAAVDPVRVRRMPNDLMAFATEHGVDEIVIALEDRRGRVPCDPLVAARLNGLRVSDYQAFTERVLGRVDVDSLTPSWFMFSEGFRSGRIHRVLKRAFDILVSLVLLVFTLPLLVVTAIAIRLESRGPVFYHQERIGLGGKTFVLTKFRSMRVDAEAPGQAQWAQKSDSRVTRVGKIIRKIRIDEIPQVLTVLKGDMSFVGPRPERPVFVDQLATEIPFYRERHSVKPGITGWAQLNYPYGASVDDAKQKLQYDLFYIKYFSILFDLSIVMQTIRVVLWPDGAR